MISLDYLAGWLDGDGHIGLKKSKQSMRAFINIRNTDLEVVTEIRDYIAFRFGIVHSISCNIPKPSPVTGLPRKPMYYFSIQRKKLMFELLSRLNGRCIVRAKIIGKALHETYERVGKAKPRRNPVHYRSILTWPYVSGFFDSDGSVKSSGRPVEFANNSAAALLMIQEFIDLGGHVKCRSRKARERNPQWAPSFILEYRNAEAQAVCEQLLPHCITKRDAIAHLLDTVRFGVSSRSSLVLNPVIQIRQR